MLSFSNTEIAFAYRTNRELRRATMLFSILAYPFLVTVGQALITLALRLRLPIAWIVKPTIFKQFIGGESLEESATVVNTLQKHNVKSILDYSVEGQQNEESFGKIYTEILRSIENAKGNPAITFVVFKPTGLVKTAILEKVSLENPLTDEENQEFSLFKERVTTLCRTAANIQKPILIDAEDSWYQQALDDICHEMMKMFNREKAVVFNTWQMYRKDRLDFLKQSTDRAIRDGYILGAKFVRGAYMEKERERAMKMGYPSPIQDTKAQTDADFNAALEFSVDNLNAVSIFCGTHNEESVELLARLMEQKGLERNDPRITFSQLYGMSDNISFNLAGMGYNVAKYIPYGPVKYVMPYLFRRAQENTSVKGQTNRELTLIRLEKKRRKKQK
ncbi:MAG: proline dehydrogenase family protein [Tenuifilaceae bacterium]|jgi:proline dehydrogenase|nr:proline dehydrogenase family protein [Bacteroidales bacterium]MDI9515842.1 proline dehydrogenase family protein [Bacteroidota bacterium]NLH57461.1 proline dehydrogenase [Rikenellaceae bacterium]OQC62107.1 MAG: bifunctional proline dehydrogenase/pyrroline-5-carboxylate dehydrogenase [Bacteroidetes bacterium ADurb.Bin008]HNV81537.1 proline dehydrogenase family protein [Tenuifilaceae bacterium]